MRLVLAVLATALCAGLFAAPRALAAEAKLSGVVWTDSSGDGVRDADEQGRGGVRVELLRVGKHGRLTIVRGIKTKSSGAWSATIGSPGGYRARVLLPGGFAGFSPRNRGAERRDSDVVVSGPRVGMTPQVRVKRRGASRRFDAGLLVATGPGSDPPGPLITIGDFIWRDKDADGIQDPVEDGLAGVTVELWDPAKTTLLATTTTNAAGYWALPGHAGSGYRVRVPTPDLISPLGAGSDRGSDSDLNPSGPDAGFSNVFTPGANVADLDAGLFMAVGDFLWDDLDSDGVQDPGEPGIAGAMVQLWNSAKTNLVASASSDSAGRYRLLVPAAGDYRVRVLIPTGFTAFSPKDVGSDDGFDSDFNPSGPDFGFTDPFSLPAGFNLSLDAGFL